MLGYLGGDAVFSQMQSLAECVCECVSPLRDYRCGLQTLLGCSSRSIADLPTTTAVTGWSLPNFSFTRIDRSSRPLMLHRSILTNCQRMLSFAGAALGCPFTAISSTSEGEQCLFSHAFGAEVAFDTNARLPDGESSAFNRL